MSIDIQTEPVAEARSETDVTDTAKQIIIDLRSKQPDDDGIANYIAGRLDGGFGKSFSRYVRAEINDVQSAAAQEQG